MKNLNEQIFFLFNQFAGQSALGDWLIVFLANYLPYIIGLAFVLIVIYSRNSQSEKIKIFLNGLISGIVGRGFFVETIRALYHHPRPFAGLQGVHQLFPETGFSFPSGHATFFFSLSAVVYHYNKRLGMIFFTLSGIMSLARIAAGVHYPLDILAGAILGSLVGFGTCAITKRFVSRKIQ